MWAKNVQMRIGRGETDNMHSFDFIYDPDGTCHYWACSQPGVVLAYDVFSPEGGFWFCTRHWEDDSGFQVVVDTRPHISPSFQLPRRAKSLHDAPEIIIWGISTDMAGTEFQRKRYHCTLHDGDEKTFTIAIHADGLIAIEPYSVHEYDYDDYDGDEEEDYYDGDDYEDWEDEEEDFE